MVLKRISVVVLAVLLFVSLVGANAAIAVDRGALNADYVKQSAAENGLYDAVQEEALVAIEGEISGSNGLPVDVQGLVSEALTTEYVRNQSEANVDRLYAFLHGEDELEIVLDTRDLKENVVDALVEEVVATDVRDLGFDGPAGERLGNLTESEESYEAERDAFRERVKSQIKDRTGLHPEDDFGNDRLASLAESEESYEAEREAFEEARKQEIQESTSREMSDEELEQAYQDRLDDIREELRTRLEAEYVDEDTPEPLREPAADLVDLTVDALTTDMTYDEFDAEYDAVKSDVDGGLDAAIDENMDEIRDELRAELASAVTDAEQPEPIRNSMLDAVDLVVDALTTDMTYEEFDAEFENVKAEMAENAGEHFLNEEEGGVPDRIELTEDVSQSDREALEPVQQAVSIIELLVLLLPLLSVGMIGGMYGISRREDAVAIVAGLVALVAGGLSAGVARIVPSEVVDLIELNASDALVESLEGMIRALFDPLWTQSLVLIAAGGVLVAIGIAIRFELGPFDRSDV